MNKNSTQKLHLRYPSAILAIIFGAIYAFSGGVIPSASANTSNIDFKLSIGSVIAISAPTYTSFDIDAAPFGTYDEEEVNVNVSTNNSSGYTLFISSVTDETALVHIGESTDRIETIESATSRADFPVDKWAYGVKADEQIFQPIPARTKPDTIGSSSTATLNDTHTVVLATNVSSFLAPGTYKDGLVFTATIDYVAEKTIFDIQDMQEMSSAICANTTTPNPDATQLIARHDTNKTFVPSIELRDARDGNTYTVRKLADGNCWMTQNLRLGSTTTTTLLTPANSDVETNYELPVLKNSGFSSNNVSYAATSTNVNSMGNNYYSWTAATAGTGDATVTYGAEAPSSICPKGWRLPAYDGEKSYLSLLRDGYGIGVGEEGPLRAESKIDQPPLDFKITGHYDKSAFQASLQNAARYWTSTSNETYSANANAFVSLGDGYAIYGSDQGQVRRHGYVVRCVAR